VRNINNEKSSYTIEDVIFNWTTKSNLGGQSEPVDCPTANSRQLVTIQVFINIEALELVLASMFLFMPLILNKDKHTTKKWVKTCLKTDSICLASP